MSILNPLAREISAKIVYYGPGLSGKTTSLHAIYGAVRKDRRGELVSLATETDRTIFFDFLPLHVERIGGLGVRFQLYTVPGQVFYGATRKLVLSGADGIVFVADSQPQCRDANLESFHGLRENITELGLDIEDFPLVFQYNKHDLANAIPVREMSTMLNFLGAPEFPSCATQGEGVLSALREITKLAIQSLSEQHPVVKREIVDDDDRKRPRAEGGIAHSVYEVSRQMSASRSIPAAAHVSPPSATASAQQSAPAATPAASAATTATAGTALPASTGLSFARLWPDERAAAILEIEHSIASGDFANAVRASAAMLAALLETLPGPRGGADLGTKAALLGLDGREYLRVCRLATLPVEALCEPDALLGLHVLVAARLKAASI